MLFDIPTRGEDLHVTQGASSLQLTHTRQLLLTEHALPDKTNTTQQGPRHHLRDELQLVAYRLRQKSNVIHQACLVETLDVVIQELRVVFRTNLNTHEVPKTCFINCFRPSILKNN